MKSSPETYLVPHAHNVTIGSVKMGGNQTVVIQSMANTNTLDIDASIEQLKRIVDAGSKMVRFTTPGKREVKALGHIMSRRSPAYTQVPVVADVHFNAGVAMEAAKIADKVRINPGNFTERSGGQSTFSDSEFVAGQEENRTRLQELIAICKQQDTALRIGVNHGSLSPRIMSRYGDTPEGMVASAMEFLRICNQENFHKVVVSLKSSNTVLMINAVRLLVHRMTREDLYFPLHLGVTESGDGKEGRVKSVAGIAPLLTEGFGDTIRVSLTEPPENEIPVAERICAIFSKPSSLPYDPLKDLPWDPFHFNDHKSVEIDGIGGSNPPVVITGNGVFGDHMPDMSAEWTDRGWIFTDMKTGRKIMQGDRESGYRMIRLNSDPEENLGKKETGIIILDGDNASPVQVKNWFIRYLRKGGTAPVILKKSYDESDEEDFLVRATGEFSLLLADRLLSGIWISNPHIKPAFISDLSFSILQATRNRITSTEYIACPSCGRTLFDIQRVLGEVRSRTAHLTGLKIAVMGCIVNGPGEMADADYGYIGAGNGVVSIYKGRNPIRKKVPENEAVDQLIEVIKDSGDWKEP